LQLFDDEILADISQLHQRPTIDTDQSAVRGLAATVLFETKFHGRGLSRDRSAHNLFPASEEVGGEVLMPLIWIDWIREGSGRFVAKIFAMIPGIEELVVRGQRLIDAERIGGIVNWIGCVNRGVVERPCGIGYGIVVEIVLGDCCYAACKDLIACKGCTAAHTVHSFLSGRIEGAPCSIRGSVGMFGNRAPSGHRTRQDPSSVTVRNPPTKTLLLTSARTSTHRFQ
jgi:hypothetical protein